MKLVTAILQPDMLQDVQIALAQHGIRGMTVSEATGYARQLGHTEVYRGEEFAIDFITKVKVEVMMADDEVDGVLDVIVGAARTGQVGDGKIWVTPLDQVVRIRTGEKGEDAL